MDFKTQERYNKEKGIKNNCTETKKDAPGSSHRYTKLKQK